MTSVYISYTGNEPKTTCKYQMNIMGQQYHTDYLNMPYTYIPSRSASTLCTGSASSFIRYADMKNYGRNGRRRSFDEILRLSNLELLLWERGATALEMYLLA